MDTYAKALVERFLKEKGCSPGPTANGRSTWIKDDSIVIQLPQSASRIDYDQFEMIAVEQLDVSFGEFDLWLGENGTTKGKKGPSNPQ